MMTEIQVRQAEGLAQRNHGGEQIFTGEDVAEKTERKRDGAETDGDDFDDADEEEDRGEQRGHEAGHAALDAELHA